MSEKARLAADAVSAPTMKEDLNAWADGFNLLAQIQSDEVNIPSKAVCRQVSSKEFVRQVI